MHSLQHVAQTLYFQLDDTINTQLHLPYEVHHYQYDLDYFVRTPMPVPSVIQRSVLLDIDVISIRLVMQRLHHFYFDIRRQ